MIASITDTRIEFWEAVLIAVDVIVIAYLFYRILMVIRGTRALNMLLGLLAILLLYWGTSEKGLHLKTTHWVLSYVLASSLIITVVVFQEEIRRGLSEMGRNPLVKSGGVETEAIYEEIVQASARLSERRFGALIVISREAKLVSYSEHGVRIDAEVNQSLLYATFIPKAENPLHDGAVIIQDGRMAFAGCFLPLTSNPDVEKTLGTRHRAAIGLTEETDAVVVVISEERGNIALAVDGDLERDLDPNTLRARFQQLFRRKKRKNWWRSFGTREVGGSDPAEVPEETDQSQEAPS